MKAVLYVLSGGPELSEPLLADVTVVVPVKLTDVADPEGPDTPPEVSVRTGDVLVYKADRPDEPSEAGTGLMPMLLFVIDDINPVPVDSTEIVADTEGANVTSGAALWIDGLPLEKVDGLDEPCEADTLPSVPPRLADPGAGKTRTLLVMAVLAFRPPSVLVSVAQELISSAEAIEVGNTLNSATMDDATWLALSVKNSSIHISHEAQVTMSTLVKVEIGLGGPVLAGINSTMLFVPTTTASYTVVSVDDVCVTGIAYSGSARVRKRSERIKAIISDAGDV